MTKKKATSKITFQGIGQPSKTGGYTPPPPVSGCTDPNALNYDPLANVDDGSCVAKVYGCTIKTDPNTGIDNQNYNPLANVNETSPTDPSSPCIPHVMGCTDDTYYEYNPNATQDDGSCSTLLVYGCTNPLAANYDPNANTDDGSCIINGCTDPNAFNYDSNATVDDGSCTYYACDDPNALNHNPSASPTGPVYFTDNSLCSYTPVSGCMDPAYLEYDPLATVDTTPTSCETLTVNGCTNPLAFNYNGSANVDDGSCITTLPPGNIPTAYLTTETEIDSTWSPNSLTDDSLLILGITINTGLYPPSSAEVVLNQTNTGWTWDYDFDPLSGTLAHTGTGVYGIINFTDVNGVDLGDGDVSGQVTYSWLAADGTTVLHTETEDIGIPGSPSTPLTITMGCMYPGSQNAQLYPTVNFHLSSICIAPIYGCMDPNATNYYAGATVDNGSCIYAGCTDPNATNYVGTTTHSITGATYNITVDDGSCTYPTSIGNHENITAGFINFYSASSLLFTRPDGTTYGTSGHQKFFIDRTTLVSAYVQVANTQDEPYNYVFEYAIGCGGLNPFIDASTGTLVSGVTWGDESAAGITTNDSGNNFYYNGSQYGIPQGSQSIIHTRLNETTANGGLQSPVGDYFTQPSTTPQFIPSTNNTHPSWNSNMTNGTYPVYGPGYFGTPNLPNTILAATTLAKSTDHPNNPNSDPVYYAFKLTTFNNSGDISVDSFVIQISIGAGGINTPGTVNYTTINITN